MKYITQRTMNLSDKVMAIQHSPIRKFNAMAQEAKDAGKKVYHLNIGQPDVETPACFMEAIRNYNEKVVAYAESGGVPVLQNAICRYLNQYGLTYDPNQILITNGGSEALSMIFSSILNPGDEVLIPEPFYTNYHTFITMANGKVVPITTCPEEGYTYADTEKIESVITSKTKAICCINPGNPTGNVLSIEDMKLIGKIAQKHDLWIISDEVYREYGYDKRPIVSFGMLEEFAERIIIIDSVSKRFSACGARIGCLITKNAELLDHLMKIAQGRLCAPTIDQIGAAALYQLPKRYCEKIREEYEARRDASYKVLMKIPGVICQKPGGAFYMTAKLPVDNAENFLRFMLTDFEDKGETVMFAPAEGFYATPGIGKEEIRIAYVLNQRAMARGVELIRLGIESYNKTSEIHNKKE